MLECGVCSTKNSIFVVGGKEDGRRLCELKLSTKQWETLASMEEARRTPGIPLIYIASSSHVFSLNLFQPKCSILKVSNTGHYETVIPSPSCFLENI